jgi:hypothetical protein
MRYNKMHELIQAKLVIPIASIELEDSFMLEEKDLRHKRENSITSLKTKLPSNV